MIYLIRSYTISKPILKIGFSDNLPNRFLQYFSCNPGYEILSTREGDGMFENLLQFYLRSLGYQYKKNGKLNEWFVNSQEVYQLFHIHQRTLEKKIWKSRDKIFDKSKFLLGFSSKSSNLHYDIFEYLYEKNKDKFIGEKIIFKNGKPIRTKSREIDQLFWRLYLKKNPEAIETVFIRKDVFDRYEKIAQDFLDNHFYKTGIFKEKMRMYCEFMDRYSGNQEISDIIYYKIKDDRFRKYYNFYSTSGCSSRRFEEKLLMEGMSDATKETEIYRAVYGKFRSGQSYTLKELKEGLREIYRDLDITSISPKATDLGRYFNLTRTRFTDPLTKKRIEGFRLDSLS